MRQPLTIAVAQPRSALRDVPANAAEHAGSIRSVAARVVVFPELSLTGYAIDAPVVGPDDRRLSPIVDACRTSGSIALVGAPVPAIADVGGRSIGTLRIDGGGATVAYRKVVLGGDEPGAYEPGLESSAIDIDSWRLGLAICKDTGVAEHAARTAAAGIDVYVAGVCESAADREIPLERARRIARDHHVWVAVASFAGPTGGGFDETAGRSFVMRPDGELAAAAGGEPGEVVAASIELD